MTGSGRERRTRQGSDVIVPLGWTRRAWLSVTVVETSALIGVARRGWTAPRRLFGAGSAPANPEPVQALAQRAVDVARSAGATYADARLTRIVEHEYKFAGGVSAGGGQLIRESEVVGCGVRVSIGGCWGFASAPVWFSEAARMDQVVQLARAAVVQARTAVATPGRSPVILSPAPTVTGTWQTPCRIDPFNVSIEEKVDMMEYWQRVAREAGVEIKSVPSYLMFARQERVLATSDGSLVTQTFYESGGLIIVGLPGGFFASPNAVVPLCGVEMSGQGWERLLDANLPTQLEIVGDSLEASKHAKATSMSVGRYTVVCDGTTMGTVLGETLGIATQLDRALGYQANAGGTSFLNDPLNMLGSYEVGSPLVTITANRSAPMQLATAEWDDEGVAPPAVTLVKDGVLHDFQTTREQATWLVPYYQRLGRTVTSNGCAAAKDALHMTLQMRPNLALAPNPETASLEALIASVQDGLFVTNGTMEQVDFQGRNALLRGRIFRIMHGKLLNEVSGVAIKLNTLDFWRGVKAIGDASTTGVYASTQYLPPVLRASAPVFGRKGQPAQRTSYSVQGVAAVVANQVVIDPRRTA